MKLPPCICKLPIRRKVTVLLLLPCIAVLLLAVATLFAFQARVFHRDYARDLAAVADIVGGNATAAIALNDVKAATLILNSLRAKPEIASAILVLPDHTVFAYYGAHSIPPIVEPRRRLDLQGSHALMIQPLLLKGRQVATLNVQSDYQSVYSDLRRRMAWVLLAIVAVSVVVAALLSNWLQDLVSRPILRLTRTAQTVADNNDYSVRASSESCGELGILTRAFNQMLSQIQLQKNALTASQQELEGILDSIDGVVWEADAANWKVSFVSRPFESIFGYRVEEWLHDRDFWMNIVFPGDRSRILEASRQAVLQRTPFFLEYRVRAADGRLVWVRESISVHVEQDRPSRLRGLIVDVTEQKAAASHLERLNRRLLDVSRLAGMAEIATGVLHNVGNVLNSVSVSVNLLNDRLKRSRVPNLRRATTMLREQNGNLADFLANDRQGKVLPEYLGRVSEYMEAEQTELQNEVRLLIQNVDHIKEIVSRQQSYAKVSGVFELVDPAELVEEALRMNGTSFERHRIQIIRDVPVGLPKVVVDRHKVLQILVNLARNAKHALDAAQTDDKTLTFQLEARPEGIVAIRVRDNGIGIAPADLTRIFQHGFTTKKDGHGFGLHSSANAAREMDGSLTGHSNGLGQGAEFTLELPVAPQTTTPATGDTTLLLPNLAAGRVTTVAAPLPTPSDP